MKDIHDNIGCYEVEEVKRFIVTNKTTDRLENSSGTLQEAQAYARWSYAVNELKIADFQYKETLAIATAMFELYCDNKNRDSDYWYGIDATGRFAHVNLDLNFCCSEDDICSVTLYRQDADSKLGGLNYIRLIERHVESAVNAEISSVDFQSTVQLKGCTYNLTIKEDAL